MPNFERIGRDLNLMTQFLQPDPYSCVPTSFAYLLFKQKNQNFSVSLDLLVKESYKYYDLKKDGMEFDQLQIVAENLGYKTKFSPIMPKTKAYLTGVKKLPICKFKPNELINNAIKENSLQITKDFFIYPYGHAVVIFENPNNILSIYDSLLGMEREFNKNDFNNYLENNPSYLSLV